MKTNGKKNIKRSNGFPSPYRVSFILIQNENKFYTTGFSFQFPSPYGVSFILIFTGNRLLLEVIGKNWVSVSLWSIIHSYAGELLTYGAGASAFPSPYGVLFILILE